MAGKRKNNARRKLAVLGLAFGLFAAGVVANAMERGPLRSGLLAVCIAALLAIAIRQSVGRRGDEK